MTSVARKLFSGQIKNVKWSRKCYSSASVKKNEYILRSVYPDVPVPNIRLLDKLWADSAHFKNHVALVSAETNKSYTYLQLQNYIGNFATSLLKKLGLKPGDMVAIAMPNSPEFPVVAFGSIQAGCVVTTVNPIYKEHELGHQLAVTRPKVIITIPQSYDTAVKALQLSQLDAKIVLIDNPADSVPSGVIRYTELAESGGADYSLLDKIEAKHDDVAVIPFSSGTTGLPKGVEISHKNLLSSMDVMSHDKITLAELTSAEHQDVVPCVLPFFHIYGMVITLLGHLAKGCKLITMSSFQPGTYFDILEKERVNLLYVVPPLVIFLSKIPLVTKEHLQHLRYIFTGAAPIAASDIEALLTKTQPNTEFVQGYGATETSAMGSTTYKGSWNRNYGSCGDPMVNYEMKFIDPATGDDVVIGEPGEVCFKSTLVMNGYYKNKEATENSFTSDGFFKTGDLGIYRPGKGLYITDRIKELIKVKGMQVAPAELEGILRSHPAVQDAGVIGIPHEFHGEVPKAFVILNDEAEVTAQELQAFVADKVSEYKEIKEVMFVDEIPKNAAGKILRRELKRMYM
ncbi:uncharacterized protein LOC135078297 [Ostrinia nubilalis]|uniref:uncharacterized protein LOC135078297 n=1 Tax=Ostrinia nubilalis TaxID=29057 RepID=UPI0030825F7C